MVELFNRDVSVISRHIRNVFTEGELDEQSNLQKMQIAGSAKPVVFYNLDVIISVGYRVKSQQGTRFRQRYRPLLPLSLGLRRWNAWRFRQLHRHHLPQHRHLSELSRSAADSLRSGEHPPAGHRQIPGREYLTEHRRAWRL